MRSGPSSPSSSTRSMRTRARRGRSRIASVPPPRSGSPAGTRTARSGSSGSSGTRRHGRRSPRLLHAEPDDVAVTTSVSQGVSALVSALDLSGERNRIVISEYEFPTVGQIAHAQELRGAKVVHVTPEADGRIPVERFAEAIDERTALVCCTALSFRIGPPQRRVRDRRARPRERRDRPRRQLPGDRCDRVRRRARSAPTSSRVAPSSTSSAPPVSVSCGSATPCARSCSRRRPAGSPTRTSSRCPSPTTRRTRRRGASTAARLRCRRSIPASRGWS